MVKKHVIFGAGCAKEAGEQGKRLRGKPPLCLTRGFDIDGLDLGQQLQEC